MATMTDHNAGGHGQAEPPTGGAHSSVFHTGYSELLLFPSLLVSTKAHLAGACLVVFMLSVLYEGFRLFNNWLQVYSNTHTQRSCSNGRVAILGSVQTVAHMVHLFIGYCLMVLFMLLNVWICLSMLLGAGTGFLLFHFRPVKSRLFRLVLRRKLCDDVVTKPDDEKSQTDGSVSYEQIADFRLKECNRKDCEARKEAMNQD